MDSQTVIEVERPDQRALQAFLSSGAFQLGETLGRWTFIKLDWPFLYIAIAAAKRDNAPEDYLFRFNCDGYPRQAPTGGPWDLEEDKILGFALWPIGGEVFNSVFRTDWHEGACLYLPCDRVSAQGHTAWPAQNPESIWQPTKGLMLYLDRVHELLHSSGYKGMRGG